MKKQIRWKRVLLGAAVTGAVVTAWIGFCGYQWNWGPFFKLHDIKTSAFPGNAREYDLDAVQALDGSPLQGKSLLFLGSSVTYGASAQGVSFADYIAARNGCAMTKNAVSGTTLVDSGYASYLSRLNKIDPASAVDLLVCQLSTNDATQNKTLGAVQDSFAIEDFDTSTVAGAIEYIIAYAKETWDCPVVFYTNPQYDSEKYAAMVALLGEIQAKWGITVIDMWNDAAFNDISQQQRDLYMADSIHPTKAGYLEWWTPYMENMIYEVFQAGSAD